MRFLLGGDYMKKNILITISLSLLAFACANHAMIKEDDAAYGLQEKQEIEVKQVPTLLELCRRVLKKNLHLYDLQDLESLKNVELPEKVLNIFTKSLASEYALLLEGIFAEAPYELYPHSPYNVFTNNDKSFSVKQHSTGEYSFTDNVLNPKKEIRIRIRIPDGLVHHSMRYIGMTSDYRYLLVYINWRERNIIYWIDVKTGKHVYQRYDLKGKSNNDKGYIIFSDCILKGNDFNSIITLDPKYRVMEKGSPVWVSKKDDYFVGLLEDEKRIGVFDPTTGSCGRVLNNHNQILCFEGDKKGDQLAVFNKHSIRIWNPYTGEQTANISHKLCSIWGITSMLGRRYSFEDLVEGERDRQPLSNGWPSKKFINLSFSAKELILSFVEQEKQIPEHYISRGLFYTYIKSGVVSYIPYKSIYMWDKESGECVFKRMKNAGDRRPVFEGLQHLSFKELAALINLEKQYQGKQKYEFTDWKLLQNSKFESIRELCKTRYLLPEHRPDSDDVLSSLVCLSGDANGSSEYVDGDAHDEDSLCTIQ
jgi:hypothetical protein